ncbi:lasso peptide biosynthesis PqqD family chaperone [Mesobacillus foraminis]|uniref:lasso peptide biosynthesis PqqD family chaperone n=1 Tax=Mesobacillus foraminis TaxID=279826 RepID=UPI0039A16DDD
MLNVYDIKLDSIISQVKGNIASDMDGETVIMSVKNSKYYNLGRMGGEIWNRIENPITLNQVVSELISEYEVEETVCKAQVLTFLELLYKEGLIQIVAEK